MTRIFIILFLLISFSLKGQSTSGTVSDTTNGKKIVGASIQSMPDATDLQTVEVLGRSAKDYNSEYSFSATRISALNKDIPQSIEWKSGSRTADFRCGGWENRTEQPKA
jgi:iron complex outermembrane receptor protein